MFILFLRVTMSLCVCIIIIRRNTYNVYSSRERACLKCGGSVFPCLNNVIRALERSFVFIRCFVSDHYLISNSVIIVDSSKVFVDYVFSICAFLRWRIYLQFATLFIGIIMSWTKTSWPVILPLVLWYADHTVKVAASRIPTHGSESSTYVSYRLYVRKRFPSTLCILYIIYFACGFPL